MGIQLALARENGTTGRDVILAATRVSFAFVVTNCWDAHIFGALDLLCWSCTMAGALIEGVLRELALLGEG